jgi:hypothetical protein
VSGGTKKRPRLVFAAEALREVACDWTPEAGLKRNTGIERGRKTRREATAALDELVSRGAILSYATNLMARKRREPAHVTVVAEHRGIMGRERLWLRTRAYVARFGRPVAFYSDKHAIFRVNKREAAGLSQG